MDGGYRKIWQTAKKKAEALGKNMDINVDSLLPKQELGPKLDAFAALLRKMVALFDPRLRAAMAGKTDAARKAALTTLMAYQTHIAGRKKARERDQSQAGKLTVRILNDPHEALADVRRGMDNDQEEVGTPKRRLGGTAMTVSTRTV
jgi:hypothetical protein